MKTFGALLAKEELALFSSPVAYSVIAVFLLLLGYTFTTFLFINKVGTLVHVFFQTAVLLLLLVPVLTMRLVAEERKQGTLEVLLTSPVNDLPRIARIAVKVVHSRPRNPRAPVPSSLVPAFT